MSTLSPRSMNLMATCWPVLLSSASSTKPNVPLFKSLICRRAHMELSTVTTPYNMHPVMMTAMGLQAAAEGCRHPTFWYLGCDCSGWVLVSDMLPSPIHSSLLASGRPRRALSAGTLQE